MHKSLPEFNIILDKGESYRMWTFEYFYAYCNAREGQLEVNYLTSPLTDIRWCAFDNNSIYICEPSKSSVRLNKKQMWYYYFSEDTLKWGLTKLLLHHLAGGDSEIRDYDGSPFIIFEDEDEKNRFEKYISKTPALAELDFDQEIIEVLKREEKYGPADNIIDVSPAWKIRRIFDLWKGEYRIISDFSNRFRDIV